MRAPRTAGHSRGVVALVASAALTTSLTACAGETEASGSGEAYAIGLPWIANVEYGPYYLASQDGYFEEQDLDVTIIPSGSNSPSGLEQLAGGDADMAITNNLQEVAVANASGSDLVVVGAGIPQNLNGLISPADAPVDDLADLVGKEIGVQSAASIETLQALVESAGVTEELDIKVVGYDAAVLQEGEVDVYQGYGSNHPVYLEERGFDTHTLWFQDVGLPEYFDAIAVKREDLEADRDQVVRAVAAILEGYEANLEGPEPAAEHTMELYGTELGLDLESQIKSNEIYIETAVNDDTEQHGLLWIDVDKVAGGIQDGWALEGIDLAELPSPSEWIDMTVLEDASELLHE